MRNVFFPFHEYWTFYLSFTAVILFLLSLDLGLFHRKDKAVKFKEALAWTIVWACLALVFCFGFYYFSLSAFETNPRLAALGLEPAVVSKQLSLEFLTGYLIEQSLSVDNLFIFVLIFSFFRIPSHYQHRILFFGILGVLLFRAIFIALGAYLMQYHMVVIIFGVFLIFTGIKMFFSSDKELDPSHNPVIKILKYFLPITHDMHGHKFFVRINNKIFGTPLLVTLAVVEVTDLIFAVDSVPAVYAVTREPLIVYTSNIFAILGLRSMYFLLASVIDKFHLLKYGLAVVLVFVGLKMAWFHNEEHGEIPTAYSLITILFVISVSIALSFIFPKKHKTH